jgi:uncharacterized protein (TIGR00645 family)
LSCAWLGVLADAITYEKGRYGLEYFSLKIGLRTAIRARIKVGAEEMKKLENLVESVILASRWLLVVFYLGLALALGLYAIAFMRKLYDFAVKVMVVDETDAILKMLALIDAALVASLVVMVIISGYENFVSRFDNADSEVSFLGKIDAGSLKIKVASTIVAISSIHLLQVFLNAASYAESRIMWLTIMHMAFVFSALFLAYIDRVMSMTKKEKGSSD